MNTNLNEKFEKSSSAPVPASRSPGSRPRDLFIVLALLVICAGGVVFLIFGVFGYLNANPAFQKIAQSISATHTPVPTLTLVPTLTPVPSPTPLPNPQLNPGRVIYSYTFEKPQGWPVMLVSTDYSLIKRGVADGKYHWEATAKKDFFLSAIQAALLPGKEKYYQISMDARVINGPPDASYSLILGYKDADNFWLWLVTEDGYGYLEEMVNNAWQEPLVFNADMPVHRGETNTLTVKYSDTTLYYYVNGWLAGEYTLPADNKHTFISDRIGLGVTLSKPGDQATFEFDNFVISVPEKFEK